MKRLSPPHPKHHPYLCAVPTCPKYVTGGALVTDQLDHYLTRDIPQALMDFLESEKAEREGFMRKEDNVIMKAEDAGYLAALDTVRFHLAGLMQREKAA